MQDQQTQFETDEKSSQKPRWLLVILISSIQLMLLLAAVITVFTWLGSMTKSKLARQTCLDNRAIAGHISDMIEKTDQRQLVETIKDFEIPNHGFVWLIDRSDGSLIANHPLVANITSEAIRNASLQSIDGDMPSRNLLASISDAPRRSRAQGKICIAELGGSYYVGVEYVARFDALLVVGQDELIAMSSLQKKLDHAKDLTFACTLLLGLVSTCMTISILNRFNDRMHQFNAGLKRQVTTSARELIRTKNAVIFGLAKLAESRDNDTGEHLDRIRTYVTILAEELASQHPEFDEEYIRNLGLASSLHDIGKVGIPDAILLKPGKLTQEERKIMELHTLIGGECLDAIHARLGENAFMHTARQVAYYHHERWDGAGYPHALKGNEIPIAARIVAVADVYDALTSKRPYKEAMSHEKSREIIVEGSGSHFDSQIVAAFIKHEHKFEEVSKHQQFVSDADATSSFQHMCEELQTANVQTPVTV